MKLKLTLAAVFISATLSFGQNARVVSAYNYLENYKRDKQGEPEALTKAKESIEPATTDESTMNKPKTWFYRGNIYFFIAQSKNPTHAGLSADPYFEAAQSYQKCLMLDAKYENAGDAKQQLRFCTAQVLNKGVEYFTAKNYAGALEQFEKCVKLAEDGKVFDTLAVKNALLASQMGKNNDKAMYYTNKLMAANIGGAMNYLNLSRIYAEKGDTATALKTLKEGRSKFPSDAGLIIDELNYYLVKHDNVGAEKALKEAIAVDPKNPVLYYAAGSNYSTLKNYDKAVEYLNKSLELKPDYGDALYNLGAVYVAKGNALLDTSNTFADKRAFKESDAYKVKAVDEFKKAIEFIEKALVTIPDPKKDETTFDSYITYVTALKSLYGNVDNTDKYNEMKKILDELKK